VLYLPLLFSITLGCDIRKELELNRTNQFLAYANDVTILGENINIITKNTKDLLEARSKHRED